MSDGVYAWQVLATVSGVLSFESIHESLSTSNGCVDFAVATMWNATADAPPDIKFKVCPQRSGEEGHEHVSV